MKNDGVEVGLGGNRGGNKEQFHSAECECEILGALVTRGENNDGKRDRRDDDERGRRQAEYRRRAGDAGEFGDQGGDIGDEHRAQREPRPTHAVMLADQARMSLTGGGTEAHGHLLHDEERHDE